MKRLVAFILFSLAPVAFAAEADDVRAAFNNYKAAILKQDGVGAVSFVSKRTVAEYQQYIDWALKADRPTLEALSLINRFQVILIRHRIPAEELRKLDGRSAFIYAVDRDWIGKNGVIRMSLGAVEVSSVRATAVMRIDERVVPNRFQFIKEDGRWRFDLVPTIRDTSASLAAVAKQKGVTEDQMMFDLITSVSGMKVPETIWQPVN